MSRRRARRRADTALELRSPYAGPVEVQAAADGEWVVRPVTGAAAAKDYRCPGCDQEIRVGTPHLVAWPADAPDERRHWHSPCWHARGRRGGKVHRSRNAPRYG